MKKMLAAVSILAVLGGLGAGGWVLVSQGDALAAMTQSTDEDTADNPPTYLQFDPIQLPVILDGDVSRIVDIEIVLEVPDEEIGDQVLERSPALNDAFLSALYGKVHESDIIRDGGTMDLAHVKQRVMEAGDSVVDESWIEDVLIHKVGERRL